MYCILLGGLPGIIELPNKYTVNVLHFAVRSQRNYLQKKYIVNVLHFAALPGWARGYALGRWLRYAYTANVGHFSATVPAIIKLPNIYTIKLNVLHFAGLRV